MFRLDLALAASCGAGRTGLHQPDGAVSGADAVQVPFRSDAQSRSHGLPAGLQDLNRPLCFLHVLKVLWQSAKRRVCLRSFSQIKLKRVKNYKLCAFMRLNQLSARGDEGSKKDQVPFRYVAVVKYRIKQELLFKDFTFAKNTDFF